MKKEEKKEALWEKMNGKKLVEMKIPIEEIENIDELVREGYYGCRSDAICDIIRRGAVQLRSRYLCVKPKRSNL